MYSSNFIITLIGFLTSFWNIWKLPSPVVMSTGFMNDPRPLRVVYKKRRNNFGYFWSLPLAHGAAESDQTQIWFEKNSFSDTNIWVRFDSGNLTQICVWSESGRPMGKYWLGFETDLSLTAFRPKSDSSLENIDSDLRLIWVWQPSDPNLTRVWKILTQIWDRSESDSLQSQIWVNIDSDLRQIWVWQPPQPQRLWRLLKVSPPSSSQGTVFLPKRPSNFKKNRL